MRWAALAKALPMAGATEFRQRSPVALLIRISRNEKSDPKVAFSIFIAS